MAFFDSPKNRALWDRKLSALREEKARRRETGYSPVEKEGRSSSHQDNPYRRRITLKELEARAEGEQARRARRPERRTRQAAREADIQAGQEFQAGQAGQEFQTRQSRDVGQAGDEFRPREAGNGDRQPEVRARGRTI